MRLFLALLALATFPVASSPVNAAEAARIEQRLTPEQMHATGLDTLSREQLDLLNRLLDPPVASTAPAGAQAPGAMATAGHPVRSSDPDAGLLGGSERPYTAQVRGTVDGWAPGTEFRLDNGQIWKVLKGEARLPASRSSPTVRLVPGLGGRWFLEVDENLPKARVYRID